MPAFGGVPLPELTAVGTTAELDDVMEVDVGSTEIDVGVVEDDVGVVEADVGAVAGVETTAPNLSGAEVPVGALGVVPAAPLITQATLVQSVVPNISATLNDSVNVPLLLAVTGLNVLMSQPLAPDAFAAHSTTFTPTFAA
ncbi:MAG: hypothetical protein BGO26_06150 [Actinobacteria bacterium 69-20]|mgnify:CR=1 FL=1|nr:MAG: hypothetical protein BGO26_06150 [Actinobacteria bacterium 69-20]